MADSVLTEAPLADETRGLARSASIVALGNIASRLFGMVRDIVKSHYFAATGAVSVYELAVIVPQTVFDLLIGGMVSSALVPVFSEYLAQGRKRELWELAGLLLASLTVVMAAFVAVIQWTAPLIAALIVPPDYAPELRELFIRLLRVLIFSLFFMSLSSVLSGLLYAFRRFTLPTFTGALVNLGIVLGAVLLHERLGVTSLAVGMLLGALLQVLVQLPGLRGAQLSFRLNWRHAGLRQIVRLYLPIVLGLIISNLSVLISARLIAGTSEQSVAWNDYATSLMQFPLGLVVTAVTVAILPTLSQKAVTSQSEFKATLAQGLRLVISLIVPAVVGMLLLARPINALLYEHGKFTAVDTEIVSLVLRIQMIGVFFAAIDQPLIFAFYARKDTLTPALVGVAAVGVYLLIALAVSRLRPLTLIDLVVANDAQMAAHMFVMLALFRRRLNGFGEAARGLWITLGKAALAALGMGILAWAALAGVSALNLPDGFGARLLMVAVPGAVGFVAYFGLAVRLQLAEVHLALRLIRQKLRV